MLTILKRWSVASAWLIAIGAVVAACSERREVFYADESAARQDGAIERGWIPEWLPKTARQIHEIHDLDTNRSMLAFSFSPAEAPELARQCDQVGRDRLEPAPFATAWWPEDVPPSPVVTHRHIYYKCSGGAYVAVSPRDGEMYYWRP